MPVFPSATCATTQKLAILVLLTVPCTSSSTGPSPCSQSQNLRQTRGHPLLQTFEQHPHCVVHRQTLPKELSFTPLPLRLPTGGAGSRDPPDEPRLAHHHPQLVLWPVALAAEAERLADFSPRPQCAVVAAAVRPIGGRIERLLAAPAGPQLHCRSRLLLPGAALLAPLRWRLGGSGGLRCGRH